ncbi:MAG: hypothetical protein QME47_05435 [Candidatus Thermoplasmatota archaeon]|nr:hypothetical protein [Candidatus Thermoplasmatota archaeon]
MHNRNYEARKLEYERRKKARKEILEARKAVYEQRKVVSRIGAVRGISISPIGRRVVGRRVATRIMPHEVLKPELEERPPLVDVIDENSYLRIAVQLSDIAIPHDITVDEITEISFKHGVLEIRLRKRKEKLTKEEKEELAKEGGEEITAEINKKVLLMLRKRKKEEKEKFMI